MTRRRRRCFAPLLAALLIASAAVVWAYWTSPGAGTAAASTASLSAATISVPGSATNSVTVTWDQQASLQPSSSANSAITYVVQRRLGALSYAAVASGGCAGALTYGTSSCADVPPATGSYSYRVVASFHTWTATSGDSGSTSFLLDTTAPTASSISRAASSPTNASSVDWTVTFSEAVTGVGSGDFALARAGGLTGGAITGVTGSGTTYTVSATSGSGDGTLGLNLVDDDSIVDVAVNALGGAGTGNGSLSGQTYTLDRTPPARASMSMLDTNANGKIDRVTVTFDETLASSTATAPWTLANVPSGGSLSSVSTSGAVATLDLSEGASAADTSVGTFTVALATSASGVRDALGNQSSFAAAVPADAAAPVRMTMSMLDTGGNGKVDRVTASFSETLASSTATAPWTLATTPSAGTLSSVSTATSVATLTIAEGAGAADTSVGSFTVALAVSASGIRDAAGNQSSFSATAPTDAAAPTAQSITRLDSDPTNSASVRWTVTFSESVTGVGAADFSLVHTGGVTGEFVSTVGAGTTSYVVTASTGTGTGSGTLGLNVLDDDTIVDALTNPLGGSGAGNGGFTGQTYTIDKTAPSVGSIARAAATPSNAAGVSWTITFSEIVTGVDIADFALARTGAVSGGAIGTVTGSGTTYTVTATTGSGDGTLGLNLTDDDTITDAATNKLGGSGTGNGNFTGQTYTIDKTAPAAPSAISVTSGVVFTSPPTCSGVTSGTRYINGTGTANSASATKMTATVTAEAGLTIVFSATGGATTVTSSPVPATASPVITTQNLSSLPDGLVTLSAYAVDAAGNPSTTATSTPVLRKDTVAPPLTAVYHSGLLGLAPHLDGTSGSQAAPECGAAIRAVKASNGSLFTATVTSYTFDIAPVDGPPLLGSVSYSVTSTDRAGNISAPVITGS